MSITRQDLESGGMDCGELWSLIRGGLSYCRDDLKGAALAEQYEVESAHFDKIARTITSYIAGDIRKKIKEAEAALEQRMSTPRESYSPRVHGNCSCGGSPGAYLSCEVHAPEEIESP